MMRVGAAVFGLALGSHALNYDSIKPHLVPPEGGCKPWSEAGAEVDKYWSTGKPPANAGAYCAQQAKGSTENPCVQSSLDHGSICPTSYCIAKSTGKLTMCTSAQGVPEQVNVQVAGPDAVVVQFITFEKAAPTNPPVVNLKSSEAESVVNGVTHAHKTAGGRTYYMHFVRLEGLTARAKYSYTVQSGAEGSVVSDEFSFRAPYPDGETRIALYGDMGVYSWNNMQNLLEDCVTNENFDVVIHSGDHCYNEGDLDEVRADGYMQQFEKVIANVPWMPVVGNHEYYSGTKLSRYLDSTFEKWGPINLAGDHEEKYGGVGGGKTSATSALGAFLSAGNHHGPASTVSPLSNSVASHTSRYFSVDVGLTHLVALSLNGYNGVDDCTTECNAAQAKWLEADLAAVDRKKTPWVIATSHFPMYLAATPLGAEPIEEEPLSAQAGFLAEECEYPDADGISHSKNCHPKNWTPPTHNLTSTAQAIKDLEPIFDKYGLDIYWAGHIHFYQTFDGPVRGGKVIKNGFTNPNGVVHVCSGNGGPPSPSSCSQYCKGKGTGGREWKECAKCIAQPYSYTRLTAHNATDLTWEQVSNADGSVIDTWQMHQDNHGPFTV